MTKVMHKKTARLLFLVSENLCQVLLRVYTSGWSTRPI